MAQVPKAEHDALPWKVHDLARDYELEDVWRLPVDLDLDDSLSDFWDQMQLAIAQLDKVNPAAILFGVRVALGRLFGWDDGPPGNEALELRRRYSAIDGSQPELEEVGEFSLVYKLDDEYLAELENSTVQAALHLGRLTRVDGQGINLAVYAKPKGALGRLYMAAIKPFRRWIVYPTILRAVARQWSAYKSAC